jgi:hypothetical protein
MLRRRRGCQNKRLLNGGENPKREVLSREQRLESAKPFGMNTSLADDFNTMNKFIMIKKVKTVFISSPYKSEKLDLFTL